MSTSNHFLNALASDVVPLGKLSVGRSAAGVFISDCSHIVSRQRGLRKSLASGNTLGVGTGSVSVSGGGTFRHSASPMLLSTLDGFGVRAATVILAARGVEAILRSRVKGVVLNGSSKQVAPVATARRVTGVAGKQREHIFPVVEQVGDAVRTSHRAVDLEQPVSIPVRWSLPQPTLVRFTNVNLRPEAGNVGIGEGWQGLGSGHVEPPFLASLRQFYQKGGV